LQEIYLDNAATTRCGEEAAALALALMTTHYGNPSSLHRKGLEAQLELDRARSRLADALDCAPGEISFTSGGTESNNLAIQGAARARQRRGKGIVAMANTHSSVLEPLKYLETQGFLVRLVNPRPDGNADADALLNAVDADTVLVCLQMVDSETGAIAPVADIARALGRRGLSPHFHCDCVQALGKLPVAAPKLGVDSISVSAHKLGAPKGCGALYLKKGARILPLVYGGGQEKGLRPGTENTPLACAFGLAAELAVKALGENHVSVSSLREYFVKKCMKNPDLCMNSPPDATPYICNLSAPGYRSETLLHFLAERGVYVSSGSACSKGAASHVLKAMGLPPIRVDSALRVSFCPRNTPGDIDAFFEILAQAMKTLRAVR